MEIVSGKCSFSAILNPGIPQNYVSLMVPKFGKQTVKGGFPLSTYKLMIYRC